jgi:hypothetical protein
VSTVKKFTNGLPDWLEEKEIFREGNSMKIINVKNTVKFPLTEILIIHITFKQKKPKYFEFEVKILVVGS